MNDDYEEEMADYGDYLYSCWIDRQAESHFAQIEEEERMKAMDVECAYEKAIRRGEET